MKTVIETPRLRLRDWTENDLTAFTRLNADPRVMEYFLHPLDERQSRELYLGIRAEIDRKGYGGWVVERKEDGRFLGFTGFHEVSFEAFFTPAVEIAWRLCYEAWGHGYAPEAASACLAYGREVLGFREVCAFTALANRRSQRVMQKIGMKIAGEFDHPQVPVGHPLLRHVLYKTVFGPADDQNE